jgi:hypothetical protein
MVGEPRESPEAPDVMQRPTAFRCGATPGLPFPIFATPLFPSCAQSKPNETYLAMSRDQISQIWREEIASTGVDNSRASTEGALALRSGDTIGSGSEAAVAAAAVDEIRLTPRLSIARMPGGGVVRRVVV